MKFYIRDVLWFTVVVAVLVASWLAHQRTKAELAKTKLDSKSITTALGSHNINLASSLAEAQRDIKRYQAEAASMETLFKDSQAQLLSARKTINAFAARETPARPESPSGPP